MALRWVGSSVGRYIMTPTQLKTDFGSAEYAGLIGDAEADVHRCSMGAGAGMLEISICFRSCSMYARSAIVGRSSVPVGNATSSTHCCPPQSKPSISSLQPSRMPAERFQNSASARLTLRIHSMLRGSCAISASRSWKAVWSAMDSRVAPVASCRRARISATLSSSFASEGTTFGPAGPRDSQPGSQPALGMGLLAITTTVSVKGIHM
mmetsp:Transcript_30882/g.79318  ORF Transcript_30882/g.79318 Transcript_30882/m.79318 type:complete len:208 (-) Transcript_30882:1122-1745(-)